MENSFYGKRFGGLVVIGELKTTSIKRWICECDCGAQYIINNDILINVEETLNWILLDKKTKRQKEVHGRTKTPEYSTWNGMKQRCLNPKNSSYRNYGGRGITICQDWLRFDLFYADMGIRPKGKSIDRIDNEKGYFKENCRWATYVEQANNTRSNNPLIDNISISKFDFIKYKGEIMKLIDWCNNLGLNYKMIETRLARGWTLERAFETKCNSFHIELTVNGKTKTIKEWSLLTGIEQNTLYTRWKRLWSDERILNVPINTKQTEYQEIEYNGKVQSLSEWCKELDLKRRIIWKRLKRGWSVKDSFEVSELNNSLKLKNIRK